MRRRFVEGRDGDFEYASVDGGEEFDDREEEERQALDRYLEDEEPEFVDEEGRRKSGGDELEGETGVQDF